MPAFSAAAAVEGVCASAASGGTLVDVNPLGAVPLGAVPRFCVLSTLAAAHDDVVTAGVVAAGGVKSGTSQMTCRK